MAVALTELAAAYFAEADLARTEAKTRGGRKQARLRGWSLTVDQFASQLALVLEDVQDGFPVSLRPSEQGPVTVIVAERAVILSHPRADQQSAYEQRVLADFCNRHDCQRMTDPVAAASPIPASAASVSPLWTFDKNGPVCAFDGLEVIFNSTQNLSVLRGICEELAQEVAGLAADLAWQRRHGVEIQWDALTLDTTPGRPEHVLRLNDVGDAVLITVPLLSASAKLFADVTPWLFARVMGNPIASIQLNASDYGWVSPGQ